MYETNLSYINIEYCCHFSKLYWKFSYFSGLWNFSYIATRNHVSSANLRQFKWLICAKCSTIVHNLKHSSAKKNFPRSDIVKMSHDTYMKLRNGNCSIFTLFETKNYPQSCLISKIETKFNRKKRVLCTLLENNLSRANSANTCSELFIQLTNKKWWKYFLCGIDLHNN